ncbi:MAG: hypothetical protein P1V81_18315 [Planctomycetota bacterium]|nr:hypothetical protein [Planctomycetota bacterium]
MNPTPLVVLLLVTPACVLTEAGAPGLARHAMASDTSTTKYGTFEVEVGGSSDPGQHQAYLVTMKHGLSEQVEIYADWSVYEKVKRVGLDDGEGIGDAGLGIRHRFWENSQGTSTALEGRVAIPTGDEDELTGTGSMGWFGSVMVSQDFEGTRLNGWVEVGVLGDVLEDDTEMQRNLAFSMASNLGEELVGYAELSRSFGELLDPAYGTLGLGWHVTPHTMLDFGVAIGMNNEAADAVYFLGFTSNLGILGAQGPRAGYDGGY